MAAPVKVKTDAAGRVKGFVAGTIHNVVHVTKSGGWDPPPDAVQPIHKLTYRANLAEYPIDHSGTIYFVTGRKRRVHYWCGLALNPKMPLDHHGDNVGRNLGSVDLGPSNGFSEEHYGPGRAFQVTECGSVGGYGGCIKLKVQLDDASLSPEITLGHFWTLNDDLLAPLKSKALVAGGTYLGSTAKHIGSSTGAHLHAEQQSKPTCFNEWIQWMMCGKCSICRVYKPAGKRCGKCAICKKL